MSTITFTCYACNQMLKVGADKAGRKTKCIQCGTILTIPVSSADDAVKTASAPAPKQGSIPTAPLPPTRDSEKGGEFDFDDRPRKRRRAEDEEDDDRPRKRRDRDEEDDDRPRKRRRVDEDEDDRPRKRRRDEDEDDDDYDRKQSAWKDNWSKVKLGCLLAFIGMCIYAGVYGLEQIGVLLFTIASFSSPLRGGASSGLVDTIKIILRIAVTALPLPLLVAGIGQIFWVFTTNKHGKMVFAIVSLVLTLIAVIFLLVFRVLPVYEPFFPLFGAPYGPFILISPGVGRFGIGGPSYAATILPTLTNLLTVALFMMMAFYTRGVGLSLKNRTLASRSMFAVIMAGVAAVYQIAWPALTRALASSQSGGQGMLAIVWVVYWLGVGLNIFLLVLTIINLKGAKNTADR